MLLLEDIFLQEIERIEILDHLTRHFHVQTDRNVRLSQENDCNIYDNPIMLQNQLLIIEDLLGFIVQEKVDCKPDNDAGDEELNVANE